LSWLLLALGRVASALLCLGAVGVALWKVGDLDRPDPRVQALTLGILVTMFLAFCLNAALVAVFHRAWWMPEMYEDLRERDVASLRFDLAGLQRRVQTQAVLVRALFGILSEKQGISQAELLARFRQVEADRAGAAPRRCTRCGRDVNPSQLRCLYCNEPCEVESAFDLL
jgi:hypothetical protein